MDGEFSIVDLVMYGGALGACLTFIAGLIRKWWRMEHDHQEIIKGYDKIIVMWEERYKEKSKENDGWKELALELGNMSTEAVTLARRLKERS